MLLREISPELEKIADGAMDRDGKPVEVTLRMNSEPYPAVISPIMPKQAWGEAVCVP